MLHVACAPGGRVASAPMPPKRSAKQKPAPELGALPQRSVALSDLVADPRNARVHNERNIQAIKASIGRFSQVEPLLVEAGTNNLIAGHGRLEAMRQLGIESALVIEVDVHGADKVALGIALNRTSELAEWNEETLAALLAEMEPDMQAVAGFTADELSDLMPSPEIDEQNAPPPAATPTTKRGDMWILGDHRLLCGDSSLSDDIDTLLAGDRIHLVNTDPPYNVKVEPRGNNALLSGSRGLPSVEQSRAMKRKKLTANRETTVRDSALKNDFLSDGQFDVLLDLWFANIARVLEPGRSFYIWGGSTNCGNYPPALKKHELFFHQAVIWVKEFPALTRRDFMSNHEWCFYGWREGAAHEWFGPSNATDVWSIKKISPQMMIHLTEKPVELASRAIEYSSRRGENVLDIFGGSGSTLIGCEQTGRRGFLMEMAPGYCDLIVGRWERATGRSATLDGDGRAFTELAEERLVSAASAM